MHHSFLYFVGTHFRIFLRKSLVHLRTVYASPQKLARPLAWSYVLFQNWGVSKILTSHQHSVSRSAPRRQWGAPALPQICCLCSCKHWPCAECQKWPGRWLPGLDVQWNFYRLDLREAFDKLMSSRNQELTGRQKEGRDKILVCTDERLNTII